MDARKLVYTLIFLFLTGCGAITPPTATPIRSIPTLPPSEDATPIVTAVIPTLETATIEVLEQTDTPQPTATIPVLQMEIVSESQQTAIPQPVACQSPPQNWVIYTVQRNDTLSSLGQRTGTNWQQIQTANCLAGTTIFAGQRLYLPFVPAPPAVTDSSPATATIETNPAPGPGDPAVAIFPISGPQTTKFRILITDFEENEPVVIRIFYSPTLAIVFEKTAVVNSDGDLIDYFLSTADIAIGGYTVDVSGVTSAATGSFTITIK